MPRASIVITSRNRREDLNCALRSAIAQTADVEVLVIDDASTDGTTEMVRREFPEVRLYRSERPLGLVVQRNRAAKMARAPVIVSIDDDARFVSSLTVEQTLADFDHPRIGAVAIPREEPRFEGSEEIVVKQLAPSTNGPWVTSSYAGTAHAVRRDVFLSVGGYREELMQMVEEPDYCLRMLDAGYVTRLGRGDVIRHLLSPKRDTHRTLVLGRRNDLLHEWHNVPMPYLPGRLIKVTLHSLLFAVRWRRPRAVLTGLAMGYRDMLRYRSVRRTVNRSTYRLDRDLRRNGSLPLYEVEHRLPPLKGPAPGTKS
jgi:glycosyltransferase involved in cell wall biosynthesis